MAKVRGKLNIGLSRRGCFAEVSIAAGAPQWMVPLQARMADRRRTRPSGTDRGAWTLPMTAPVAVTHTPIDVQGCSKVGFAYEDMLGAFRVITLEWMPILGENAMGRHSWLQKLYWSRFGKPAHERELIKFLIGQPISSVLEIGIGDAARMRRLAKLVTLTEDCEQLRYIGIDEFESATGSRPHLSLKQTHQLAKQLGFRASLVPGDHQSAVVRVANKMTACDLIIVDGGLDPQTPSAGPIGAWLHRLAHADSTVFASQQSGGQLIQVDCRDFDLPQRRVA